MVVANEPGEVAPERRGRVGERSHGAREGRVAGVNFGKASAPLQSGDEAGASPRQTERGRASSGHARRKRTGRPRAKKGGLVLVGHMTVRTGSSSSPGPITTECDQARLTADQRVETEPDDRAGARHRDRAVGIRGRPEQALDNWPGVSSGSTRRQTACVTATGGSRPARHLQT